MAKAIDCSLKCWSALTRYCKDGAVPLHNNRVESQIRPRVLEGSNWLLGGWRSGQCVASVMSLVRSDSPERSWPVRLSQGCVAAFSSPTNECYCITDTC